MSLNDGSPTIFLLTPLREGRRASSQMRTNICGFLLTPLREGRPDASLAPELFTRLFLLTPLREGRHDLQSRITTMNRISTHAPAGGATKLTTGEVNTDIISTHAPAGGATYDQGNANPCSYDFYSRPCGRGDIGDAMGATTEFIFLLTPLREGRRNIWGNCNH